MKNLKSKMLAAAMTAIVVISGAVCALAATPTPQAATARPRPAASETSQEATAAPEQASTDTGAAVTADTAASEGMPSVSEKKYTTKGGAFGWFLLSVIVNAILSFAIGNRFYKMSKKDSHITAEIRALRRDVEEKFAANVGGFSEPEMDISNSNDDYSSSADGIKMNSAVSGESQESAEDIFRKWESQLAQQRAEKRAAIREAVKPRNTQTTEEFVEDGGEKEEHQSSRSYQPMRRTAYTKTEEPLPEESEEDFEEEENKFGSIKSKAKELITDIFPFRED